VPDCRLLVEAPSAVLAKSSPERSGFEGGPESRKDDVPLPSLVVPGENRDLTPLAR
jgi:hypothetical protein